MSSKNSAADGGRFGPSTKRVRPNTYNNDREYPETVARQSRTAILDAEMRQQTTLIEQLVTRVSDLVDTRISVSESDLEWIRQFCIESTKHIVVSTNPFQHTPGWSRMRDAAALQYPFSGLIADIVGTHQGYNSATMTAIMGDGVPNAHLRLTAFFLGGRASENSGKCSRKCKLKEQAIDIMPGYSYWKLPDHSCLVKD